MTPKEATRLTALISAYTDSAIADSWAGSADPDDYEKIIEGCVNAKAKLDTYIQSLIKELEGE